MREGQSLSTCQNYLGNKHKKYQAVHTPQSHPNTTWIAQEAKLYEQHLEAEKAVCL